MASLSLQEYMAQRQAKKGGGQKEKSEKSNDSEIQKVSEKNGSSVKTADDSSKDMAKHGMKESSVDRRDTDKRENEGLKPKPTQTKEVKPLQGGLQTAEQLAIENKAKEKELRKELEQLKAQGKLSKAPTLGQSRKRPSSQDDSGKKKTKIGHDQNERSNPVDEAKMAREQKVHDHLKALKNEGINVYENSARRIEQKKGEIKAEDPALLFDKTTIENHKNALKSEFISITGRKLYPDASRYPVNRYGIAPGWRWDGIIRGNGFEHKWLDAHPEHSIPDAKKHL